MPEGKKSIGLGSFGDKLGLRCHCGHLLSFSAKLGIYLSPAQDGHHQQTHKCTGVWLIVTSHILPSICGDFNNLSRSSPVCLRVCTSEGKADRAPLRVNPCAFLKASYLVNSVEGDG